jgi:hypothetical protein
MIYIGIIFKSWYFYLFTLKNEFLTNKLLDKKTSTIKRKVFDLEGFNIQIDKLLQNIFFYSKNQMKIERCNES